MSGISGFYQNKFDYTKDPSWSKRLTKMKDSLLHRGFNDNDVWLSPHCGLANVAIKEGCCIAYDGDSTKDCSSILDAYLAFGWDCVQKLTGMFAFAIYDSRSDTLLLARDHLGIKPLYYYDQDADFVFGSEPKALFAYGINPSLNEESWGEVLGLGPARSPGHGVYAGMKEVLAGHFLVVAGSRIIEKAYWQLEARPHEDGYEQTVEKASWLVERSIIEQMASSAPMRASVCTFLSGGLDSSLVSAVCNQELHKGGKQLSTFSFDFVGNDVNFQSNRFQASLDRPFVDIMAKHIGSHHAYLECDIQTQADLLLDAMVARDLPCMADIESSLHYFCSQVSQTHRVALTGEGADEVFGGYPWFRREEMWNHKLFPWSYDMDARTSLLREDFLKENHIVDYARSAYEASLAETPRLSIESGTEARRREIAWLNVRWFAATLLHRMDRTGMYNGLEVRAPFADYRILEYVYNIPWEMKYKDQVTKSLLIETGKKFLPPEILYRKKSPYPKTYDKDYEVLLAGRLRMILDQGDVPLLQIADKKKILQFLESPKDYGRPWYGQLMAGPQMMGYLLQINDWMRRYRL